ncbi:MAG: hypothetical protein ACRCZR_00450 [Cetobacterium sp.]
MISKEKHLLKEYARAVVINEIHSMLLEEVELQMMGIRGLDLEDLFSFKDELQVIIANGKKSF